jgi:homoserine dehydrogenase
VRILLVGAGGVGAAFAAITARSTSSFVERGVCATISPVAGS